MNKIEETLLIIKPDAVKNGNIGKIINIIEKNSFDILYLNMINLNLETAKIFYFEHFKKPFFNELVNFIISGPVVFLILRGENAISNLRNIIGDTDYRKAKDGSIRKIFGISLTKNAVHASDSNFSFEKEKKVLFDFLENEKNK